MVWGLRLIGVPEGLPSLFHAGAPRRYLRPESRGLGRVFPPSVARSRLTPLVAPHGLLGLSSGSAKDFVDV